MWKLHNIQWRTYSTAMIILWTTWVHDLYKEVSMKSVECSIDRTLLYWPGWLTRVLETGHDWVDRCDQAHEVSLLTNRFDQCPLIDSTLHWAVNYRTLLTKPSVSRQCCRQCCHVVRPCNKTLHHEDGAGTHNMHWLASVLQCTQLHVCRVCTLMINVSVYVYKFYN